MDLWIADTIPIFIQNFSYIHPQTVFLYMLSIQYVTCMFTFTKVSRSLVHTSGHLPHFQNIDLRLVINIFVYFRLQIFSRWGETYDIQVQMFSLASEPSSAFNSSSASVSPDGKVLNTVGKILICWIWWLQLVFFY